MTLFARKQNLGKMQRLLLLLVRLLCRSRRLLCLASFSCLHDLSLALQLLPLGLEFELVQTERRRDAHAQEDDKLQATEHGQGERDKVSEMDRDASTQVHHEEGQQDYV